MFKKRTKREAQGEKTVEWSAPFRPWGLQSGKIEVKTLNGAVTQTPRETPSTAAPATRFRRVSWFFFSPLPDERCSSKRSAGINRIRGVQSAPSAAAPIHRVDIRFLTSVSRLWCTRAAVSMNAAQCVRAALSMRWGITAGGGAAWRAPSLLLLSFSCLCRAMGYPIHSQAA